MVGASAPAYKCVLLEEHKHKHKQMSKKDSRHKALLNLLRNQGHTVINISNAQIAALLGVTEKTIQRDINELVDKEFIIKETHLINSKGETKKQRDIILKGHYVEEEAGHFEYTPIKSDGTQIKETYIKVPSSFREGEYCYVLDKKKPKKYKKGEIIGYEGKFVVTGMRKTPLVQRRFSLKEHKNLSDKDNHKVFTTPDGEVIWMRRVEGISGAWERNMPDKEFESEKQVWGWIYSTTANHHKKYTTGDKYSSRADD